MGETDEFIPQSSHAEEEAVQEPAAEKSAAPIDEAPAEKLVVVEDVQPETAVEFTDQPADEPVEPDELDEISQSLSDEAASDTEADSTEADASADAADSFDDIAPPVVAATAASQVPEPSTAAGQVPWWPFLVYLAAWVILAAAAVWQLLQFPADQVVYESTAYALTILGGLIMTATGPLLILAVWLGTRANRSAQEREGLLTSALMKGALVTLSGAIIWWASIVIIDYLRLGRLL